MPYEALARRASALDRDSQVGLKGLRQGKGDARVQIECRLRLVKAHARTAPRPPQASHKNAWQRARSKPNCRDATLCWPPTRQG